MDLSYSLLLSLAYVVLALLLLAVAKIVKDLLTPYRITAELTEKDNPALGAALSGYFAGVIIVFIGATVGPMPEEPLTTVELLRVIGTDALYALGGVLALNVGRVVLDRIVLRSFSTVKEIIEDRNVGTGAVEAGAFIATGLVVAGAVHGEGGGPLTALAFFGLGQLALVLFALFYRGVAGYDVHAEIERDNVAAGVAMGANFVAVGVILLGATHGDFLGWEDAIGRFAYVAGFGFALLLGVRWVTDGLLLPKTTIAHEIVEDRNLNAAWIEGVVNIGMAAVLFFLIA